MSLYLHKFLPLLVLPLGLALFLLVLAFLFRSRFFIFLAGLTLYAGANPQVADFLLRGLEERSSTVSYHDCSQADAIVVLGGIVGSSRRAPSHVEWGEAVDRFEAGLELLRMNKAPVLVFTGGKLPWITQEQSEASLLAREAERRGVSGTALLTTKGAANTEEEAEQLLSLNRQRKMQKIILVTSAFHYPRAEWLFKEAGFEVVPFPVDFRTADQTRTAATIMDWMPSADALVKTQMALREHYGLLYYWTFGKRK